VTIPADAVTDLAAGPKLVCVTGDGGISVLRRATLAPVGQVVQPLKPMDPVSVAVSSADIGYVVDSGGGGTGRSPERCRS
jgi:hypothetical protein